MIKAIVAIIYDENDEQDASELQRILNGWGIETCSNSVKNEIRMFSKDELKHILGVVSSRLLYFGVILLVTKQSINNVMFSAFAGGACIEYQRSCHFLSLNGEGADSNLEVLQLAEWIHEYFNVPKDEVKEIVGSYIALQRS